MKRHRLIHIALAKLIFVFASIPGYAGEQEVVLSHNSTFSVYALHGRHEKAPDENNTRKRRRRKKEKKYILKAPPPEWVQPAYRDEDWSRHRRVPYFLREQKSAYLRTWFEVKDPSSPIHLNLRFRGGIKVYLNGQEIANAHIKEGKAEAYPLEAYTLLGDEKVSKNQKWSWVRNLSPKFENMREDKKHKGWRLCWGGISMQKPAWERLLKLRNRKVTNLQLPGKNLMKGKNLLAIEIHRPDLHPQCRTGHGGATFTHHELQSLEMKADPKSVPSTMQRPKGTVLWADDIHHRVFNRDFLPALSPTGALDMLGARGGSYNAQMVLGTSVELSELKVTLSPLKDQKSSALIEARNIELRYARSSSLKSIGTWMGGERDGFEAKHAYDLYTRRYCPAELEHLGTNYASRRNVPEIKALFESLRYFDQLSSIAPKSIAANSTQPIWVTLSVPNDTPAGVYQGSVQVEANGGFSQSLPLKMEVVDWQLPEARDFSTLVWCDQNPFSVANHYKVKAWSEEHLKLTEKSLLQLSRISSDILMIPVVDKTEFNTDPKRNPIQWTRKEDGSFSFDYTYLDQYLDLATKHLGIPKFIVFMVTAGGVKKPLEVSVKDEASGQVEVLRLDPVNQNRKIWAEFAVSLYNHMQSKGLHQSIYWGLNKDISKNTDLEPLLAEYAPDVMWTTTSHGRLPEGYTTLMSRIYGISGAPNIIRRGKVSYGWKKDRLLFSNSRVQAGFWHFEGYFPPFVYRPWAEMALANSFRGVGRFGADHWGHWHLHYRRSHPYTPGFGAVNILWPGEHGADGSARLEIFREGLQEAEAKMFLEKAVDGGLLNQALSDKISQHLINRVYAVQQIDHNSNPPGSHLHYRDNHQGWQERSRTLYQLVAEVAKKVSAKDISSYNEKLKASWQKEEKQADFEILVERKGFRVQSGTSMELNLSLVNHSKKDVQWTANIEPSWATLKHSSGSLKAGQVQLLQGQFAPKGKGGEITHATFTIKDQGGQQLLQQKVPFEILQGRPEGQALPLSKLPKDIKVVVKSPEKSKYKTKGLRWSEPKKGGWSGTRNYSKNDVLLMEPYGEEITFHTKGSGIKSFATELAWRKSETIGLNERTMWKVNAIHCEVYVDGKLAKKSLPYKGIDVDPTLVVVEGLENAKTVKLVCTYGEGNYKNLKFISLIDPTFYK